MQNDEQLGIAGIGLLLGSLVLIAVLGVLGYGVYSTRTPTPGSAIASGTQAPAPIGDAMVLIYYEIGKSELPLEAGGAIITIKETLEESPKKIILISGYHDPSGDPEQNAELAKQRAIGARDGLVAAGVPAERIKLRKPEAADDGGDPQEARRVEIRVQ